MTNPTLTAAALTALVVLPSAGADAEMRKESRGIQEYKTHVWNNQIDTTEVIAFPFDCTSDCDFIVHLAFVPDSQSGSGETARCLDASADTPWVDCEGYPSCALWAEFGDDILPMSSFHGRDEDGRDKDNYAWITAPIDHYKIGDAAWSGDGPAFIGRRLEVLKVLAFELEVFGSRELCRVGLHAIYTDNSRRLFR